jgi:hypothetical protein
MRARGFRIALLAGALAAGSPGAAQAPALETAVKAAFLPKFAPYVSWPSAATPPAGSPYVICVVGRDPFGALLDDAAAGERIGASAFVVRRLVRVGRDSDCHMAFIGGSPQQSVADALAALDDAPVLTITDERLAPERGMVHFELKGRRVRFHVDEASATRAGIGFSSKLMRLGLTVKRGRG